MNKKKKLRDIKSVTEFENSYWYALELKKFVKDMGVSNSAKMRKTQLESIIKRYIQTGEITKTNKQSSSGQTGHRDELALKVKIQHYISNKETKAFILAEALKLCPNLPKKSGVWYWTNRWREEQMEKKGNLTYRQLVAHFVKLSCKKERLPQIPSARFNNFISDFLSAKEGNREEAKIAWEQLKKLDIPKTFSTWKDHGA